MVYTAPISITEKIIDEASIQKEAGQKEAGQKEAGKNFCSDNVTGPSPEIMQALIAADQGPVMPYGDDPWTSRLDAQLSDCFERKVTAFAVATGTAANALALACFVPPYGAILCHREAHINSSECGAPEFMTAGAKLIGFEGEHGLLEPETLRNFLTTQRPGIHRVQPKLLSLTQASEAGTIYSLDQLRALCVTAKQLGLAVHIDGARFANALITLQCSPAEASWKQGVDVLCLGATKNGAIAAELVIFFNPESAQEFAYRRKRAGHLFSKMRFLSTQLEAWFTDDLWLRNARHANNLATELAEGLARLPGIKLLHPVQANEIFVSLPSCAYEKLHVAGFSFYDWPMPILAPELANTGQKTIRLVLSFNTPPAAVTEFLSITRAAMDESHNEILNQTAIKL